MNGEDVYGRKITVCLPDEAPFYLNNKKWSYLSRRRESPSPQRRPGRERYNSRSYTPDDGDDPQDASSYDPSKMYDDYTLVPASDVVDRKGFRTPGGPVSQDNNVAGGASSNPGEGSPVSPSHVHTLPNSNSARYYTKSSDLLTPSDFQEKPPGTSPPSKSQMDEARVLLEKLTTAGRAEGKGAPVLSLGAAPQSMSLKDIPLPPSGYQFMPPPNMPPASSSSSSSASAPKGPSVDAGASAVDPISMFEKSSKDSQLLKPGLLGPIPTSSISNNISTTNSHISNSITKNVNTSISSNSSGVPGSQPAQTSRFHPGAYFKHPEPASGASGTSGSSRQQHHPPPGPAQHQARSLSVPGGDNLSSDDAICMMHGYPPASAYRSQSQSGTSGAGFHTQQQQQPSKNRQGSGGFNRRPSPAARPASTGQTSTRPSPSPDPGARSSSPSANPSSAPPVRGFRPRLQTAPSGPTPPCAGLQPPVRQTQRQKGSHLYRVPTPVEIGDPGSDYFHPDFRPSVDPYVELVVSNLDYNISPLDWRKVIYATFQPHVKILSIQVRLQADNTSVATLRLPTEQDARFAIAQYHRRKIGYKRINVQLKSDCSQSPAESLRMDTIALLMEERDNRMALSRLIDLFDKRFHKTVSVSDVYKMRDTVHISESGGGGRWVKLQPNIRRTPTPTQNNDSEVIEVLEQPVCSIHCAEGSELYVEALNSCMLPNVLMLRKHFSPQLHSLLLSHNGYIPLMSFPACYGAEFSPIQVEKDGGIPLEHVISCVPGVEICVSKAGVKVIQFQQNREPFYDLMKGNSWQELGKISREVMELLRQQPTCSMPVSKFIPAYHHYFGKQCRVADYGYTKLQELFEAIPHAIQVLGTGDRKAITLSPRAQLKRFTTDIVKVVKAQPAKQIMLDKFPAAYEDALGKPLLLAHYGVCYMEDILSDIPTTTLIVIEEGNHVLLALPRRDQTPEEVERTKKFSLEVVDLLKTCPQCCMPFNKFIPAYHHHFGRQCRVADYGFSKLADLFESVSHIVRLEDEGQERLIQLTVTEMRSVLCEQLTSLLRPAGAIPVSKIQQAYGARFNFGLKLDDYGAESTRSLLLQLKNHIKIETYNGQEYATLVKEFQIPALGLQVMQLLMDESGGCLPLQELCTRYQSTFSRPCDLAEIKDKLGDYIQVEDTVIRLSLQQSLGRNLRLLLLHRPGQRCAMGELYQLYRQQYGVDLSPALYGFSSLYQLLLSFPHILEVTGKPTHKVVSLSGMLATPGVLPPARVEMKSSQQPGRSPNLTSTAPEAVPVNSPPTDTDTLMHASQLWDSAIIAQSPPSTTPASMPADPPAASTRILNMLSASTAALAASQAVKDAASAGSSSQNTGKVQPSTWQMDSKGDKVVSGNLSNSPPGAANETSDSCDGQAKGDADLFTPGNQPLDTSSTAGQSVTASPSSTASQLKPASPSQAAGRSPVSSPAKRKPKARIAANFGKQ